MKIAYLHGLESKIDPKSEKIIWLNTNFEQVYTPSINYRDDDTFNSLLTKIRVQKPNYIVGSSMGGYFAYHIGNTLEIDTILFNPAMINRPFEPKVKPTVLVGATHHVFLGEDDTVVNGLEVKSYLNRSGIGEFNFEEYEGGHRVPAQIFISSIKNKVINI